MDHPFQQLPTVVSISQIVSQFREGLNDDVLDLLITKPDSTTLNDLIKEAINCDNRIFERRGCPKSTYAANQAQVRPHPAQHRPQPAPVTSPGPVPMDLSAVTRGPLSEEEKQRRREFNLCNYCGEPGHYARYCPNKPTPGNDPRQ